MNSPQVMSVFAPPCSYQPLMFVHVPLMVYVTPENWDEDEEDEEEELLLLELLDEDEEEDEEAAEEEDADA